MTAATSCRPRRRARSPFCSKIFCRDERVHWNMRERTSMKLKANGITINYRIDGPERAPWLVFSNSLASSLAMWDEQAVVLSDKFRVLRYDQRGHGETEAPAGRYAFDTLLDDALRSEEHTSELQSRRDLVCRLLLEKKKK